MSELVADLNAVPGTSGLSDIDHVDLLLNQVDHPEYEMTVEALKSRIATGETLSVDKVESALMSRERELVYSRKHSSRPRVRGSAAHTDQLPDPQALATCPQKD
eukprot:scaffold8182_cov172-Pinguiococcus_pyrenoidosus.AAC.1